MGGGSNMMYVVIILIILAIISFFVIVALVSVRNMKKNPFVQMLQDPRTIEGMGGKENFKRAIKILGRGANLRGYVIRLADASLIKVEMLKDVGFPYVSINNNDVTISLKDEGGVNLISLVSSEQTETLTLSNENPDIPNENISAQPAPQENPQPVRRREPVNPQPAGPQPLKEEKELDPYEQWMALQNQDKR